MNRWPPRMLLLILVLNGTPAVSRACNVPVFRYALERWRSTQEDERYQAVVFRHGPLSAEQEKALAALRRAAEGHDASANVTVEVVDPDGEEDASLPRLVLRSPRNDAERRTIWSGPLTEQSVQAVLHSPARREIAERLLRGDSVVWLLLESGDEKADNEAAALLQARTRQLETTIQLPDPTTDDSAKLLSNLPLRLTFSTLRVRRSDPAESVLIAMLLHSDSDLPQVREPMVFPIFGRGRALDAMLGKGINGDTLQDAARFLCGACSCVVKRQNPGMDLLITADWDAILEDGEAEPSTPATSTGERVPIPSGRPATVRGPAAGDSPTGPRRPFAWLLVLVVAGAGVLAWKVRPRKGGTA